MPEYPKEQIWKIYEQLPDELKDAIFSEETAEHIANICEKNGIENTEKISEIARITGNVLLGLLMPDEFQEVLEEELKLKKNIAKKISFGIHRFIFFPVKAGLSALYQMDIKVPGIVSRAKITEEKITKQRKKSGKKDVYREVVE